MRTKSLERQATRRKEGEEEFDTKVIFGSDGGSFQFNLLFHTESHRVFKKKSFSLIRRVGSIRLLDELLISLLVLRSFVFLHICFSFAVYRKLKHSEVRLLVCVYKFE